MSVFLSRGDNKLIGLIGDLHGRVFHALAAVMTWQRVHRRRFDLLIQVGDLGTVTRLDQLDSANDPDLAADPAEADLARFLNAEGRLADLIIRLRAEISHPVYFIRGNHEDFDWLASLPTDPPSKVAPTDPFGIFHYVPDGAVLTIEGLRIGFLGGVEEEAGAPYFDERAYHSLLALGPGAIDLLVTHEGPYGSSIGYHGDIHGSRLISDLIEALRPPFQVAGHAHQLSGPRNFGLTSYLGLDGIVASPRWHPEARGLQPGSLAVLDTTSAELVPVTDPWLSNFTKPFDFVEWAETFLREGP